VPAPRPLPRAASALGTTLSYRPASLRGPRIRLDAWLPIIFGAGPLEWSAVTHCLNGGALFGGPGLFPFRQWSLAPTVSLPDMQSNGLRSLTDFGTPAGALDRSVLYTRWKYGPRLPLKAFRREPAITRLDKSFAPILSSSKTFSTVTRSRPPCSDSLSLRLPFRLGSLGAVTRGLIMQKASGRVPKDAPTACGRTISGLFHSPRRGSFRLSLAVLVRYRSSGSV